MKYQKNNLSIHLFLFIISGIILSNSCKDKTLVIGDDYGGGKVAYILTEIDSGYDSKIQHGLIAAPSDQSSNIQWYNGKEVVTGAKRTFIGSGNINTFAIDSSQGPGNYAAKLCSDLVLNGKSDWYLPSKDELKFLYKNSVEIGGFTDSIYWSSSEYIYTTWCAIDYEIHSAWWQSFSNGNQSFGGKDAMHSVRAIRAF